MGRRHRTAALLSLVLSISACADEELPAPLPDGEAEPGASATPDDDARTDAGAGEEDGEVDVAQLEQRGRLQLPDGAGEVTVTRLDTGTLRGVFTLASSELDAWCESQGLGPSTPASRVPDATERERFGVGDDVPDEGLRRCRGSAPDDPRVQREVLVTGADGPQATVHLLVDVNPLR